MSLPIGPLTCVAISGFTTANFLNNFSLVNDTKSERLSLGYLLH